MTPDTRGLILQQAEYLIRTRGYSAFSYADLAEHAGITKASVHYHFPTKEELIVVLVREYMERFVAVLASIKQRHSGARERLRAYAQLFLDGFEKGRLPLCGALSAQRVGLPASMHPQVQAFFRIHLEWLTSLLEEARAAGAFAARLVPAQGALLLLSTLEGGTFVGWALAEKGPVLAAFEAALDNLDIPYTL